MGVTERARRNRLRSEGIGGSREAVLARRTREQQARIKQVRQGDRLPGWIDTPSLATPENIDGYLQGLDPQASAKAEALLYERGEKTPPEDITH